MDAGVPLKKQVAGISIGLMSDNKGNYKLLTDIQGPEDHYGDMDFKVAGTRDGINAIQMDVKVDGITADIFGEALQMARKARMGILDVMDGALAKPRPDLSPYAPRITVVQISPDKIGEVIGPGGKIINGIRAETGNQVTIDIEEDGRVFVAGTDQALVAQAVAAVKNIAREFKVGEFVEGNIIKVLDFGAIVDLGGGRDGMIHVSELKEGFVKKVEDVVKLGDFVRAKIIRAEDGKIGLSLKQVNK
jgi:polyribonucleotide nucleotidyltransferase